MNTETIINWIGGAALGALLVMGQVFGLDADPLPEPAELTDAQVAAQTAQQEQECAKKVGPNYIFLARKDHNVCRDGSLK